jgi:hypothetical protein
MKISIGELWIAPEAYRVFITTFAEYLSPLGRKISRFAYKARPDGRNWREKVGHPD